MLLPVEQRHLLAEFLRRRREALPPEAAGRAANPRGRRRTPGLRREEVAQLCGLSTTWYTWVEQGRDIALSAEALARLADTLRLSAAERSYLFELTRRRDPMRPTSEAASEPPPALPAALHAVDAPAYLLDRLWHVRGANAGAMRLFAPWFDSGETCLLRYVFLGPTARRFIVDWDERARRLLAEFRADTAHIPDDPGLRDLVRGLTRDSPDFAAFWNSHAVLARDGGSRTFDHPEDGLLRYEQITFVPAAQAEYKFVMLLPRA